MKRSVLVLGLAVVILAEALATGKPIFYNLAYSLLGIVGLSYFWAWYNVNWIQLERHTESARSQVGKVAEERFLVRNRGPLPKLWLEVRDHSDLPAHYASMVVAGLGAWHQRGWTVRTTCLRRGRYRLGPLTLVSGDPFGLFVRRRELPATSSIVVYPLTVDLAHFAPLAGEMIGGGTLHRRTHYVTTNVAGVRDYYPGDTFNRIHWPSTARTGRLIVKEFELDPTADIWLFMDMEGAVQAERPVDDRSDRPREPQVLVTQPAPLLDPASEEYVVAVTASLAKYLLRQNRAVGLLGHSQHRETVQPDRGDRQWTKISETLAVIRAEGHVSMGQLLAAEGTSFGRNSMVVVITPSTDTHWVDVLRDLSRRGVRGAAVVIDAASFGGPEEADGVLQALAESGIPAYRVREGDALASALGAPASPPAD